MSDGVIAVLSDVHGNMTAFDAVLTDIDARGITRIFNLGDVAGKGPQGSAAIARSIERCELTVRGNWDEFLPVPDPAHSEGLRWWRNELTCADRQWLQALPFSSDLRLGDRHIRMFHASADMVGHRVRRRHTNEEFAGMFANTPATGDGPLPDVVMYGDIHDVYAEVMCGKTLINVGSVGNPLDETTASYAIVRSANGVFSWQIVRVPYDVEAELAIAREMGMPELEYYDVELRTGEYRGEYKRRVGR